MMQALYFTVAAIGLYFFSDWLLNRIEVHRGKRFQHRSLIFFVILFVLAAGSFELIQRLTAG